MRNQVKVLVGLVAVTLLYSCTVSNQQETTEVDLFEEGATDWEEVGDASWTFESGVLVGTSDSTAGFVRATQVFENFELTLAFKPDSTINSGVYVSCGGNEITPTSCYEINIWDLHPNQDNRTGAVVLKAIPLAHIETLNKWNTYKIVCHGNTIKAWVNGVQTVDFVADEFSKGYIALQSAGTGEVRFRDIKLKKL